jgi:hypothetical protein
MDVIEAIRSRIEDHREQISDHLLSGGANSYDEYMYFVGKAQTLRTVLQDLEEIEQRYIED